jgi:phosphoglycolate phosphatase-like HAD superfamily hydrolase
MAKPTLLALDIDGTLIDTRSSFGRIIRELSGIGDDDIVRFRNTGGFNDDWELVRAAMAWVAAGRPHVLDVCRNWQDVIAHCGHDPGDVSSVCIERYRHGDGVGYWRQEKVLLSSSQLVGLQDHADVVACTGRDQWELEHAELLLQFHFPMATTMEVVKKPNPVALLRLVQPHHRVVVLVGDTEADRLTVVAAQQQRPELSFVFVEVGPTGERTLARWVETVWACAQHHADPVAEAAHRWSPQP